MKAETFAGRVRGSRRIGAGYIAHCPAHDDQRESLSFRDGDRGLVLKCHAGCSVDAIARALGLRVADFFNNSGTRAGTTSRVVAEYRYCDERGELLYVVERREPKAFRQRRLDGRGGWTWSLGDVRRVLYLLPELCGHRTVYVVEGEKDADRLAALGLPATTNAGGAGKWRDEYTKQLHAAGVERVVILPDNDAPGEAHALAVARSCLAAGIVVKIARLPGLAPKGDVSDWLDAGHTREELAEIVKSTPALDAAALEDAPGAHNGKRSVLVRLADVAAENVEWLWPGRVARGKLTLLVGDPGLGKSFLTLDVTARVSRGRPWPDTGGASRGDVVLLSAEDGLADTIRPRLDKLGADVARVHALRAVRDNDVSERPFNLETDVPALEQAITHTGTLLVVIDPLSAYLGDRDSYKDAEIRGVLGPLGALAERQRVAVIGIMHLTKDQQRRALYRALGSVAFVAAARVVLAVAKDPEDDGRRLLVTVKNNVGPHAPGLAFRLDGGRLAWEPGTVDEVDADAVLSAATTADDREERRDADHFLRELLADGDVRAAEGERAARANGIAPRTLDRARRRVGVRAYPVGFKPKVWWWTLRPKDATSGEVAFYEQPCAETDDSAPTSSKDATVGSMASYEPDSGALRPDGVEWVTP